MNLWTILGRRLRRAIAAREPARAVRFRPGLLPLEDRTVPAADLFADATALTGTFATATGSNVGATAEAGEPTDVNDSDINSVWWKWTAPAGGRVEVNTFGSELNTNLSVYSGGPGIGALTLAARNDDAAGPQSQAYFEAVAGATYFIAVDGDGNQTGDIRLHLGMAPANDDFASAALIGDETVYGSNLTATAEDDESGADGDPFVNSVWWKWTAAETGPVSVNTFGSDFDTVLSVFTGTSVDSLALVVQNDDAEGQSTLQSEAVFTAIAGTTYYFSVDGFGNTTGAVALTGSFDPSANHPPSVSEQTFTSQENSPIGTLVGTVAANDPDPGQTLTYSIVGGNATGTFAIDATTGELRVQDGAALDYETIRSFQLTVRVTDDGDPSLSDEATVTVDLTDANEAPYFAGSTTFWLNEHSPVGTFVGPAQAGDPDPGQEVTYSIVGGNTGGAFAIDPATGVITVANPAAIDAATTSQFVLTVRATDDGSPVLSTTADFTVVLRGVNGAPVVGNQSFDVDENTQAGTVVGTVAASDPDPTQRLTYEFIDGNAGGAFAIHPATGAITVANPAALDYEGGGTTFTLTVQVTDDGSPALATTASITITVRDVNEAPVLVSAGSPALAPVTQGAANPGTLVSALLANATITDPDAGAVRGIAVIGANTTNGTWQFSTDGGATWSALGAVSVASARLLAADALTRVRFVPAAGYAGTIPAGLTFRIWDQTSGANGGAASTEVNGGSSAFSTATASASITVTAAPNQIGQLIDQVRALQHARVLPTGVANSMVSHLTNADRMLNNGNKLGATVQLLQFSARAAGAIGPHLTLGQGLDLIGKAFAIIVGI